MSELKEHLFCECDECIREYRGPLSNEMRPYYLKSEADKVIAELKDKALQYKVLDKEHCRDLNTQERCFAKQIAHNKYKRCLDKAEMCQAKYDEEDAKVNGHYSSWEYISKEMKYWERWSNRWLELAEKFKPNNSTAQ